MPLRLSTPKEEAPLQASKWISQQFLLDVNELNTLFDDLKTQLAIHPSLYFCLPANSVAAFDQHADAFLQYYKRYIQVLREGDIPSDQDCRAHFTACLSQDDSPFYLFQTATDQFLLRNTLPIIQMQHHRFDYSPHDNNIRSMVFGSDTITWGLQLSYPQMFLHPSGEVCSVTGDSDHFNQALFRFIQRWLRANSEPVAFDIGGRKISTSLRIGKACKPWIQQHSQLNTQSITVL